MTIVDLTLTSPMSQALSRSLGAILPAKKVLVYRDNLDFFRSLDVLVVSERTSLLLKSRYGLERPLMVLADHGAGDRAIAFTRKVALFDHVLAAGPKLRDRFISDAGVPASRITIVGYPKFDTIEPTEPRLPMQLNGRPTVLYNPHVSPHLSSWYRLGTDILEYFYSSSRYNLIFAPHIMLFQRRVAVTIDKLRVARTGSVAGKYRNAANIHIDCGSLSSTDMSYVRAADIYLGDCSSQVYEFLRTPRPCVFLNAQGNQWRGNPNFGHWRAGPVIRSANELDLALDYSMALHEARFRGVQNEMFDHTFNLSIEPSSVRAANVIRDLAMTTSEHREGRH